jgi:hypothetical protein
LGLGWSSRRGIRQHRGGCRYGKSDLHLRAYSLLDTEKAPVCGTWGSPSAPSVPPYF